MTPFNLDNDSGFSTISVSDFIDVIYYDLYLGEGTWMISLLFQADIWRSVNAGTRSLAAIIGGYNRQLEQSSLYEDVSVRNPISLSYGRTNIVVGPGGVSLPIRLGIRGTSVAGTTYSRNASITGTYARIA